MFKVIIYSADVAYFSVTTTKFNNMINKASINSVVNSIAKNYQPQKIILFGSAVSGSLNEDSDIDLLIIKDSNLPNHQRSFEVYKSLMPLQFPIDILVYTNAEYNSEINNKYSFLSNAMQNAEVVYEQ